MKGGLYDGLERVNREREEDDAWNELYALSRGTDTYSTYFEVMARMDPVGDDEDPMGQYEAWVASLEAERHTAVDPRAVAAWERHLRRGCSRTSPYTDAAWVATMSA